MEREIFEYTLRTFQHRRPFQFFTVELVDGDRIEIDHPEAMIIRGGVCVFISDQGNPTILDHEGVRQVIGDS